MQYFVSSHISAELCHCQRVCIVMYQMCTCRFHKWTIQSQCIKSCVKKNNLVALPPYITKLKFSDQQKVNLFNYDGPNWCVVFQVSKSRNYWHTSAYILAYIHVYDYMSTATFDFKDSEVPKVHELCLEINRTQETQ